MKILKNLIPFFVLFSIVVVSEGTILAQSKAEKDEINKVILDIRSQRTMAESRVKRIKKRFKDSSNEYNQAQSLYEDAYANFDGYVTAILTSISQGEAVGNSDSLSKSALESNKKFLEFADAKLSTPASDKLYGEIIEIGKALYNFYKSNKKEKRNEFANFVKERIEWKKWDDIK